MVSEVILKVVRMASEMMMVAARDYNVTFGP
jgi:hypothetical protein